MALHCYKACGLVAEDTQHLGPCSCAGNKSTLVYLANELYCFERRAPTCLASNSQCKHEMHMTCCLLRGLTPDALTY